MALVNTEVPVVFPSQVISLSETAESWIQVAKTGKFLSSRYGTFEITEQMLSEMVLNSTTSTTRVPVDYDHLSMEPQAPENGKAAGWFKELALRDGGKTLWGLVEWTPRATELIRDKEYQYISPTFVKTWTDPESGKAVGAKLLAAAITNHPFLRNMAALSLSTQASSAVINLIDLESASLGERQSRVIEAIYARFEGSTDVSYVVDVYDNYVVYRNGPKLFKLEFEIDAELKVTFTGSPVEVLVQYTPVASLTAAAGGTKTMADETKPTEDVVQLRAQLGTLSASVTQLSENLNAERSKREAVELELNTERATTRVNALIAEGKLTPAQKDWAVGYALSNKAEFEKFASTLTVVVNLNREHGSGEKSKSIDGDPVAVMATAVTEYIAANGGKDKVKYGDAVRAVSLSNPGLAEAYRAAMTTTLDED
jgi:phage I-like protein